MMPLTHRNAAAGLAAALMWFSSTAIGASPGDVYTCNAQIMSAAQAVLSRRNGATQDEAMMAALDQYGPNYSEAARNGVTHVYSMDGELFANTLGGFLLEDVKKECMGE